VLYNSFPDRWTGHGCQITWLSLTLSQVLFVGMQEGFYATEVWDHNNLINCIEMAAAVTVPTLFRLSQLFSTSFQFP
jgi:hypothetical protein